MCLHYFGKFGVIDWAVNAVLRLYVHLANLISVSKIVKRVVSYIIFTPYARNVCLQHERKHVDAGATSPTAYTFNKQCDSSCLLVLGAYFQFVDIWDIGTGWRRTFWACNVNKMWLTHALRSLRQWLPVMFVVIQWLLKCTCKSIALTAQSVSSITQSSGDIYFIWRGLFMHRIVKCLFQNNAYVSTFIEIGLYLIDTEKN